MPRRSRVVLDPGSFLGLSPRRSPLEAKSPNLDPRSVESLEGPREKMPEGSCEGNSSGNSGRPGGPDSPLEKGRTGARNFPVRWRMNPSKDEWKISFRGGVIESELASSGRYGGR
ncbi:hypothetical protein KM043_012272 [Ampulex compressa]|nr:hypothetical protein KM043_012272 [Ampulex compressa]